MNLALFDFDGTITSADTFTPFVYFSASRFRIALGAAVLSPMIFGYRLGIVPTSRMRAAIVWCAFKGRRAGDVREAGAAYARTLPSVVRPEALERIDWHKQRGDTVVVVSASLDAYLVDWCSSLGIELVCSELESQNGALTGRYAGGDCTGPEKARRVRARYRLAEYTTVYAYGDTEEDRELLELAHEAHFRWQRV